MDRLLKLFGMDESVVETIKAFVQRLTDQLERIEQKLNLVLDRLDELEYREGGNEDDEE